MLKRFLHYANEGLAFLLELFAIAALGWWGFHTGQGLPLHLLLGLGTPLAAAALWGAFAAPRATFKVPMPVVLAVKALVFGAAAVSLHSLGHHPAAIAFAVVATLNTAYATADRDALVRRSHAAR